MGFVRRFGYYPGSEVISQIEGVAIIDLPPPGAVTGVGTGVVAALGECQDMTYAVSVDTSGNVTTKTRPQELFSSQDMINKIGGFDETIGDFGISGGNLFASLRNKSYSRLIAAPVNLASAKGCRVFRELPLCRSVTDTNPVVPVLAASVAAGREFRSGVGRLRLAQRTTFTATDPITKGVGGTLTLAATAVTQPFVGPAAWDLIARPDGTTGARKGDIIVIGYNNAGAKAPVSDAGTYRVQVDPTAASTTLTIERLDGATFAIIATTAALPWRLHFASDADSAPVNDPALSTPGGYSASQDGGYIVAIRPITSTLGLQVDGTPYTAGLVLTPLIVPTAMTGDSWDVLSGLGTRLHVTGTTAFTAAVQGINPAVASGLEALYSTALTALLGDDAPVRDINVVVASRTSTTIRSTLRAHVLTASTQGRGRGAIIAPALTLLTVAAATADADPGVGGTSGAARHERLVYAWPGERTYIPEAVNFRLKTADGLMTSDGILDMRSDFRVASVISNLAPERNPAQTAEPIPTIMASVLAFQRGVSGLGLNEYTALRASGIMALRIDRTSGPIYQSGITTSLTSGEKNINRRRMADFIEDSLAERLVSFAKLPLKQRLKDAAVGEARAFLNELLSPNNSAAQRINDFQVDAVSGNTPALEAKGIFVIIVRVRLTPTADFIVIQAEIGENVVIQRAA